MIQFLKSSIYQYVKNFLNKKGFFLKKQISRDNYDALYLLMANICAKKNLKIIQIGTNDGISGDPLNNFIRINHKKINYIGIEPQLEPYELLKKNYNSYNNFYFINSAIGKKEKKYFYKFNENYKNYLKNKYNINFKTTGINSFLPNHLITRMQKKGITKNYDFYYDKVLMEIQDLYDAIESKSSELISKFQNIDFLQIDCEGYDDEVIYNSRIKYFNPEIINFESKCLSEEKLNLLIKYLKKNNYEVLKFWKTSDTICFRKN